MIRHTFAAIVGSLARGRVRRQSIRALEALSDRQLLDIGLPRSEIASFVDASLKAQRPAHKVDAAHAPADLGAAMAHGA